LARKLPSPKDSNSRQERAFRACLGERFKSVIREASKLENLPFVVLILLAGISLISRLWLIRHRNRLPRRFSSLLRASKRSSPAFFFIGVLAPSVGEKP
jgi:hypothetical protein